MRKILIFLFVFLFMGLSAHADLSSGLYRLNNMMNTLDQTEQTINNVKNRIKKIPSYNSQTQTNKQNTNYSTQNYNYSNNNDNGNETIEYTQQQTIQQGHQYDQNKVFKGSVSTLAELPAGAIVMDPKSVWNYRNGKNYSGDIALSYPVFWRKLEDNHYVDGSTLLLSELEVASYPFCHKGKGLRAWDESDVRRFLRTTFYTHLSEGFKNAIVNVDIPFVDMNGSPKTVNDNFFLLSIVEWGLSDRLNNGSVIKYNDLPAIYETKILRYVDSWKAYEFNRSLSSLTRTINRPKAVSAGYTNDVFEIEHDGVLDTTFYDYQYAGLSTSTRPAVNIKSSTKVSGPYEFKYYVNNSKTMIYYTLDF